MTAQPWFQTVEFSPDEEGKVAMLQAAVADIVAPSAAHRAFCTRGTYIRYLRARSWNVARATKMLHETLNWRAEYHPERLCWGNMQHEGARGAPHVQPHMLERPDRDGRPVLLMRPRVEKVYGGEAAERIKWVVYMLEHASAMADATSPDGKIALLLDFVGFTSKNAAPFRTSMQVLHILQNHYPERLGRAVLYRPPTLFYVTWKAASPFVDPQTRDKLIFLPPKCPPEALAAYFDPAHIDDSLGGNIPIANLWSFDGFAARMAVHDQAAAAALAAAEVEVAAAGADVAAQAELNAEFERNVVVM